MKLSKILWQCQTTTRWHHGSKSDYSDQQSSTLTIPLITHMTQRAVGVSDVNIPFIWPCNPHKYRSNSYFALDDFLQLKLCNHLSTPLCDTGHKYLREMGHNHTGNTAKYTFCLT